MIKDSVTIDNVMLSDTEIEGANGGAGGRPNSFNEDNSYNSEVEINGGYDRMTLPGRPVRDGNSINFYDRGDVLMKGKSWHYAPTAQMEAHLKTAKGRGFS